jgi:hypothetical protein
MGETRGNSDTPSGHKLEGSGSTVPAGIGSPSGAPGRLPCGSGSDHGDGCRRDVVVLTRVVSTLRSVATVLGSAEVARESIRVLGVSIVHALHQVFNLVTRNPNDNPAAPRLAIPSH